ncbi:MAG TPA: ABC transporter permease [Variovorax sp.]|nr:ABC transporter permease [Variovorax sp.]
MNRHSRSLLTEFWLPLVLVALWWVLSERYPSTYSPPLSEIVALFRKLWLFEHARTDLLPSLINLAMGYSAALVVGIVAGTVLGLTPRLSTALWPTLEFLRAIPGVALLPVFVILLGVGPSMKVALISVGAMWPILLNTIDGVRSVEPTLRDVAASFRIPLAVRLRRIVLPAASPQIFSGARISLSVAVILIVVSEMVGANGGIGYFVRSAERSFAIPEMWSGIIVLGLVGYALNTLFRIVEAYALDWHRGMTSHGKRDR